MHVLSAASRGWVKHNAVVVKKKQVPVETLQSITSSREYLKSSRESRNWKRSCTASLSYT